MTARIKINQFKAVLLGILFVALFLQTLVSTAQTNSDRTYRGFFAGFGTRLGTVSSNIEKIHQTNIAMSGGQAGLTLGNRMVKSKVILLGYYSSTGKTAGTIDIYQSNASVNFYPLASLAGKNGIVQPYLSASVDYDQFKFYGYYLNREPGSINYSHAEAPYLGKIKQMNATAGIGVEVSLKDQYDFIHLFSEVRFGRNLSSKSKNTAFESTSVNNQMQINVGVSFGAFR